MMKDSLLGIMSNIFTSIKELAALFTVITFGISSLLNNKKRDEKKNKNSLRHSKLNRMLSYFSVQNPKLCVNERKGKSH
jgi:hypothetical protein